MFIERAPKWFVGAIRVEHTVSMSDTSIKALKKTGKGAYMDKVIDIIKRLETKYTYNTMENI